MAAAPSKEKYSVPTNNGNVILSELSDLCVCGGRRVPWSGIGEFENEIYKNQHLGGIVPGLGGGQKVVDVFFVHFLVGKRKTHKQNP